MEVIAVIAEKGGVGKTTTATNISSLLSRNSSVLLVDLDPQCNSSLVFLRNKTNVSIYNVITSDLRIESAANQISENLSVVSSSDMLASLSSLSPSILNNIIMKSENDYDYVIVDTPPTLSALTINAICAANRIIVPVQADVFSLQGLVKLKNRITHLENEGLSSLREIGVLMTRVLPRTNMAKEYISLFRETSNKLGFRFYESYIHEALAVRVASSNLKTVVDYSSISKATEDYIQFVKEAFYDK